MKTIAQRDLCKRIDRVLGEVQAGERVRITVDGRPVADLVPIERERRVFVPREEVLEIVNSFPLDREFAGDIADAAGQTIDEL